MLEGPKRYVTSCAFSDDGSLLAAGSGDRSVLVWHVESAIQMKLGSSSSVSKRGNRFPFIRFRENKKVSSWDFILNRCDINRFIWYFTSNLVLSKDYNLLILKQLNEWTTEDVCGWLADQGLAEYAPNFRVHAIDGRELVATSDETLENKLGVGK